MLPQVHCGDVLQVVPPKGGSCSSRLCASTFTEAPRPAEDSDRPGSPARLYTPPSRACGIASPCVDERATSAKHRRHEMATSISLGPARAPWIKRKLSKYLGSTVEEPLHRR